ncbi:hypothetical protein [Acrocarpospora sp. B8E8]|uniref:hypothetical protein n=1 Tax=Acrocarpospora sp. B8E8 TaxID=3153572 RepID=UPI00325C6788
MFRPKCHQRCGDCQYAERLGALDDVADLLCNRGDYRVQQAVGEARVWYVRAVEAALAGPLPEGARAIEALAGMALAGNDAAAARLLGAATVLRGAARPGSAKLAAAARAALGDSPYQAAYQAGALLPLADALRLAGVPESAIHMLAENMGKKEPRHPK